MKVLRYIITFAALITLNFALPRVIPGDPLSALTGDPSADMPVLLTEEMRARLLSYYGLDKPVMEQFTNYLSGLARGDLGWSIYYNVPVRSLLWDHLKWTLLLMGTATLIAMILGILVGTLSAWHRGTRADVIVLVTVMSTGAWPPFFLAMLLIILFAVKWPILPIGGARSATPGDATSLQSVADLARHLVLPVSALVISQTPSVYYVTRNSLLQVLGQDYIRAARARGLREKAIMLRHALPNGLLPVVTMLAMRLGFLITGTMVVEVVFAYPGMGSLITEACAVRDYPVLQGAFLAITISVLLFNLLADSAYGLLDPRVRVS